MNLSLSESSQENVISLLTGFTTTVKPTGAGDYSLWGGVETCCRAAGHLQEVLAGADEGELSAGAVGLRLAASDSLDQLRDLLRHHLNTRGEIKPRDEMSTSKKNPLGLEPA